MSASTLPDEPQVSPPEGQVGFLLAKLGYESSLRYRAVAAAHDLDPRQVALVRYVARDEGRSQQELAAALDIPPSRMVSLVDDLEARQLLERRSNPTDRRAKALYVTSAGRQLLASVTDQADVNEQALCADLSPAERELLLALLHRLATDPDAPRGMHPGFRR